MTMRLAPLALLLVLPACQAAEEASQPAQEEVQAGFDALLGRHLAAVNARDLDTYAATLADDVTVIFPNGEEVQGRDAVVEFHREWFADDQWVFEPQVIEAHASGNLANALVRYSYRDTPDGPPRDRWLALMFRDDGDGWLLYHDQNTPIDAPAAPAGG